MPLFDFDVYNLLGTFLITFGIQVAFFVFAAGFKTDKLTDFSYGLTFIILAALLMVFADLGDLRILVSGVLVIIWGLRLMVYLFVRILKIGKDDRFDGRRENVVSFAMFWLLQAAAVWIIMLPSIVVLSKPAGPPIGVFFYLGAALWVIGFLIETVADQQKFVFKNDPANKGKWIQHGLWKYSRHPNYFGEVMLWFGLFVMAVPVLSGWTWAVVLGPIFITVLLLKVSGIPLLEESADKRYGNLPEYQEYKRRTHIFLMLPPKK